jgi:hypothetical protein
MVEVPGFAGLRVERVDQSVIDPKGKKMYCFYTCKSIFRHANNQAFFLYGWITG